MAHRIGQSDREALATKLLALDRIGSHELLSTLSARDGVLAVADELVAPVLEKLGEAWDRGELSLAEMYLAGRICEELVDELLPATPAVANDARLAVACLHDKHLLGSRIVLANLRSARLAVRDYGRLDVEELATRMVEDRIEVALLSVLMLPSALLITPLKERLRNAGSSARIAVGGAPFRFDAELWRDVGADAMGRSAGEAVAIVHRLGGTS